MSSSAPKPVHLEPSKLGTKEYWDTLYTREITNHAEDPSDTGTVWFDDSSAEEKVVAYLQQLTTDPPASSVSPLSQESTTFLDLGTGNGSLLFALRSEEWTGRMLGVDYSPQSISLARQIASSEDAVAGAETVDFKQWDIIHGSAEEICSGEDSTGWDVVLDKGTFDAISLSEQVDDQGRRLCEGYKESVSKVVKKGGLFLVTSCNWTEDELRRWFEGEDFAVAGKVDYPTFSFGGVKGQTISTLCFQRL